MWRSYISLNIFNGLLTKGFHVFFFDFRTPKASHMDELAAVEESADFFLAKTIRIMEEKMNDTVTHENDDVSNTGDCLESGNVYS